MPPARRAPHFRARNAGRQRLMPLTSHIDSGGDGINESFVVASSQVSMPSVKPQSGRGRVPG